ncbi:MAG: hemin-degrading factor [Alphaproteobacteria bacterium]|nr:hemin-degrading factor [Alphaproteobacteria bacterium]
MTALHDRWTAHMNANPRARARDAAAALGVSEAALIDGACGVEAIRLSSDWGPLLGALRTLGEVMALTRNEAAVHEKIGVWEGLTLRGPHGVVYGGPIDLRIFPRTWRYAFAVQRPGPRGPRRSLQFFDAHGDAVHKVHLREGSNVDAFDALVGRFREDDAGPVAPSPRPAPEPPDLARVDAEAVLADWAALQDTHDFHAMLRRSKCPRRHAVHLAEGRFSRRVAADAPTRALEQAAAAALPIMIFVPNPGCIQIHSGPVETIRPIGPWINVLDPGFNLHLRADLVDEAWVVRKPTRDGEVTALELFDAEGGLIALLFGVRKEGQAEDEGWRALLAGL